MAYRVQHLPQAGDLARVAGENVGSKNITGGTFSAASANYSAPTLLGTPTLTIAQAALTATIAFEKARMRAAAAQSANLSHKRATLALSNEVGRAKDTGDRATYRIDCVEYAGKPVTAVLDIQ